MSSKEWKEYCLGDIVEIKHGFAFKGEFFSNEPTDDVLLTPGNFNIGGGFKGEKFKYYNGNFPKEYLLSAGDILVTMTDLSRDGDTLGFPAKIPKANGKERYLHNQRLGLLKFIDENIDQDFIYWLLRLQEYQNFILGSATGTTVRHTSPSRIREYKFFAPSPPTQQKIAKILSALDDKIELNRQTNQTLENIAQTLFKEWFINYNYPNATGEMQDSKLGQIPKGWSKLELSSIISIKDGTHNSPKKQIKGKYLITTKHLKEFHIDFDSAYKISDSDFHDINKRSKVDRYDILISMIGTVGNIYFVLDENINFAIKNIGLFKTSERLDLAYYIYFSLTSKATKEYFTKRLAGSTQQYLTLETLRKTPIVLPDPYVLAQFSLMCESLYKKIDIENKEIKTLTQLRDTLLPKLMKGEIEV